MASSYTATDARAYEHLMGRWSTRLAKELIAFGGLETGDRVLDVGCGTGSMALALAARPEPMQIVGNYCKLFLRQDKSWKGER